MARWVVVLVGIGGLTGVTWLRADPGPSRRAVTELAARLETERVERHALERELGETRQRLAAYRDDVGGLIAMHRSQLGVIERTVRGLDAERRAGERILRAYGPGVALIQGVVVYEDDAGRPWRNTGTAARRGREPRPLDGPSVTTEGDGPVVRTTVLGSGFLVSREGAIVTSRHLVRPWDEDDEMAAFLEAAGLTPRVTQLRAFFPGVAEPVLLTPVTASDAVDVIVLRGTPPRSVPVLPLLNQIQPYVTWGHLADARPHQLAHDAATATGSSGGPIFGDTGRVIGLSAAVMRDLDGAAFGVPIRAAAALLEGSREVGSPRPRRRH